MWAERRIFYLSIAVHKMTPALEGFNDLDPLNTCGLSEIKRHALLTLRFLDADCIAPHFYRYNPSRPGTHCIRVPEDAWTRGSEKFVVLPGMERAFLRLSHPRNVVTVFTDG